MRHPFVNGSFLLILILMCLPGCGSGGEAGESSLAKDKLSRSGTSRMDYRGWANCLRLGNDKLHMIVTPQYGGRILSFGPGEENLVYEDPCLKGVTLKNRPQAYPADGMTLDVKPEHPAGHIDLWIGEYTLEQNGPLAVRLTSPADRNLGIQLVRNLQLVPGKMELRLDQFMVNKSNKPVSHALWKRDMMKGGGFAFLPLNPKSALKDGWTVMIEPLTDAPQPHDPRVTVVDDLLVLQAVGEGKENKAGKIGCDSVAGWLAYARGNWLLIKAWEPKPPSEGYPYTVEVWFENRICELEPLSPWVTLAPGEKAELNERWYLLPLSVPCGTVQQAVALREVVETFLAANRAR